MEPTWVLLNFFVLVGGFAVCLAFVGLLPVVGNLLASMWVNIMGEQLLSRSRNRPSGTDMDGINT